MKRLKTTSRAVSFSILAAFTLLCTSMPVRACSATGAKLQLMPQLSANVETTLTAPQTAATQQDNSSMPASIVGLWDAKLLSNGQVVDEGFDAFHSDGTEILIDQSPPATDNVCLGVWEQTGPRSFKLKHPSWYFDLSGNLLGEVIIHETLTIDADGDSFHGTAIDDAYDTLGNKVGHTEYQVTAKRIKID